MRLTISVLCVIYFLTGCTQFNQSKPVNSSSCTTPEADMKANLYFLASDELEGRQTGRPGQRIAARFIESEMRKANLIPAGDNGTYFQNFKIDVLKVDTDSTYLQFYEKKYLFTKDFIAFPNITNPFNIQKSDIVFLGYGVKNDSLKIDDLSGKDLNGKWVIVLSGLPKGMKTKRSWDFSASYEKQETLGKLGVQGIIEISNENLLKNFISWNAYMFKGLLLNISDTTKTIYEAKNFKATGEYTDCKLIWVSRKMGDELLAFLGLDSSKIRLKMESGELINTENKSLSFSGHYVRAVDRVTTQNVVGFLKGSNPKLNNTFVALSAHYDHRGIKASTGEIYSGADDNGSGTTVVLENLKAFSRSFQNGNQTQRSLLFVFHTGEEEGLIGSQYLTDHGLPIMDSLKQIIADINIDMVGRESVDSIEVVGHDRLSNDFSNLVEKANRDMKLFTYSYTFNDPNDPSNIYKRSDHYNYAQKGIPIVFFTDGMGENWQSGTKNDDYHRVTDTADKINYGKMVKVSKLSYEIMKRTANLDMAPPVDRK